MEQKIVVHMKTGAIHKGVTHDFHPPTDAFHLLPAEGGGVPLRVAVDDLKALFYVKDYLGNRDFVARKQFDEARSADRKAIVTFKDGEEVWGYLAQGAAADSAGADTDELGFYFFPADDEDNNIRIYVVRSAMEGLRLVP